MSLYVLNNNGCLDYLNETYICLIPNIKNPVNPTYFSPISPCNVGLNIVTKTITNRIKHLLGKIISHSQSAFITRRLIVDNIILAFEALYILNMNNNTNQGYIGIELVMANLFLILFRFSNYCYY